MKARILIVEDDPMNAKVFQLILARKADFDVVVTEDPSYVLEETRAGRVALVIMDVSLSRSQHEGKSVDGLAITRLLKEDPAAREVPVLLATAHAMKGSREKFLAESGADDYVSKPILSADELIARVRNLLRKGSHAVSPAARR
jgi:CheY-like chemotaxis protein